MQYPAFTLDSPSPLSDLSSSASPTFVDIDGDGDMDAFTDSFTNSGGNNVFFRNTGTPNHPEFSVSEVNPFGLNDTGSFFVDIDSDSDFDAFSGSSFYENTGTTSNPAFAPAITNPFGLSELGGGRTPVFADIDGDGDFDAFESNYDGETLFFMNTGNANTPMFAAAQTNPFGLQDVSHYARPNFVDIDGDGDLDAFISSTRYDHGYGFSTGGDTLFFENKGTVSSPAFASPEIHLFGLPSSPQTTFVDIDADGDSDSFVGDYFDSYLGHGDGTVSFFINNSGGLFASTAGNDKLTGTSSNNDAVTYASATAPITVSLLTTTQQNTVGAGLDTLTSIENLIGSGFNDNLTGNTLNNVLNGKIGHDTLSGWSGADTMIGGLDNDTYFVENIGDKVIEKLNEGTDTINSKITQSLAANVENLILTGTAAIDGDGNDLANVITGNNAVNTLNGWSGADTMIGGAGNDTYFVEDSGDAITEKLNEGIDTVNSEITHTLAANVENLILARALPIDGTGNNLANVITGSNAGNTLNGGIGNDTLNGEGGNDTLIGWSGADTMIGGLGNDTYFVENAGDKVIEKLNEGGKDTVSSKITHTLVANVENLTLTGTAAINATGNDLANVITGNSAANQLTGGTNRDIFKFITKGPSDKITDYNVASDTVQLENAAFTALTTTGTLNASQFRIGTQAVDANDFIIYNKTAGTLLYDADGSGAAAATQIATLSAGLGLTNADIVVI